MAVVEDNVAFLASTRGLRYALRDLRMDVTLDSSAPLGWRAITWSVPLRFSDRTGLLYKIGESVLVAQQADDRTLKSASLIARAWYALDEPSMQQHALALNAAARIIVPGTNVASLFQASAFARATLEQTVQCYNAQHGRTPVTTWSWEE